METPYKLKTVQVLLTTPDYDWERVGFWVNEGPAVFIMMEKSILPILHLKQALHTVMGMLTAVKMLISLIQNRGLKNAARFFDTDESKRHLRSGT